MDLWQVVGGVSGLVSAVIAVVGAASDRLSLLIGGGAALTIVGIGLAWRWGGRSGSGRRLIGSFSLATVIILLGGGLIGGGVTSSLQGGDRGVTTPNTPPSGSGPDQNPTDASTTGTTPSSEAATTTPGKPVTRRTGRVSMSMSSYSVDLDSTQENWGIAQGSPSGSDITVDEKHILVRSDFIPADRNTTGASCEASTDRRRRYWQYHEGETACVKTTEQRWAVLTVGAKDATAKKVTIDIVVWDR